MEDIISMIMSAIALVMSAVTTYLNFFYERSDLTATMDRVPMQIQSSGSASDDQVEAQFRYYVTPAFVLTLQGTRPLVVTDVNLIRAANREGCIRTETKARRFGGAFETIILEKGAILRLAAEFELESSKVTSEDKFAITGRSERWCLELTAYDQRGRRVEALMPAFDVDLKFAPPQEDERYPTSTGSVDVCRGPVKLVTRSSFKAMG